LTQDDRRGKRNNHKNGLHKSMHGKSCFGESYVIGQPYVNARSRGVKF
jgi:hypothetical protein